MPVRAPGERTDRTTVTIRLFLLTGRVLSRQTDYDATVTTALLRACAAACRACADECASHAAMHEHCRICAEACRRCEHACDGLVAAAG